MNNVKSGTGKPAWVGSYATKRATWYTITWINLYGTRDLGNIEHSTRDNGSTGPQNLAHRSTRYKQLKQSSQLLIGTVSSARLDRSTWTRLRNSYNPLTPKLCNDSPKKLSKIASCVMHRRTVVGAWGA